MRTIVRGFFRLVRLLLTPPMLLWELLSTPKAPQRSAEQQAQLDQRSATLALYQYRACPFCIKVRKESARLGLSLEKRNAKLAEHGQALLAGGGALKVPCLRISNDAGDDQWLYESADINRYLQQLVQG